ncbi:MGD A [Symbiodinium natans]|uniref:monogalactosyldiacylglycerol synthase n=1 Tax=Symbiodinium natans TaxID=878477 RepID=A0A812M231_9DINO|nr:MGD A [Symbiodinium natans]
MPRVPFGTAEDECVGKQQLAVPSSIRTLKDVWRSALTIPYRPQQQLAVDVSDRQFHDHYATRIQAAWRRAIARQRVANLVACNYTTLLLNRCCEQLTARMQAKAFVAARNHHIRRLREEVAKSSGFVSYLYRREKEIQIQEHLDNEKHCLRAALLIQAWWKGCLVRGFEAAHRAKQQRAQHRQLTSTSRSSQPAKHETASALAEFFDNPSRTIQQVPAVGLDEKDHSSSDESKADRKAKTTSRHRLPLRRLSRTRSSGAEEIVHQRPRQIQIYFSDTGGGHRASALSLEAALKKLYGSQVSVTLVDFIRQAMPWPLSQAPETYQTLGHFPSVYKRAWDYDQESETWRDTTSYKMMWSYCRESVLTYLQDAALDLDLIISVHPLIHHVVIEALEELSQGAEATREDLRLPVVTVVTDLGSAHLSWFDPRCDMLFVPSQEIYQAAIRRGAPKRKIHLCGLPLREGFWSADPVTPEQKRRLQEQLGLRPTERPEVVLLMGGGEGFGKLLDVACAIGDTLIGLGYGQLVVVCGRNEEVRKALSERRWMPRRFGEWLFEPLILGFVTNVDQYMTAADCLVTKAGPGSIAESMIKGLPCLLTAFVPGQEEGNISYVTENGAGAYVSDQEPDLVAAKIEEWLKDPPALEKMSENARRLAQPGAALEISRRMCDSLLDLGVELAEVHAGSFGTTWRDQLLHRKEQRRKSRQKGAVSEATTSEECEASP